MKTINCFRKVDSDLNEMLSQFSRVKKIYLPLPPYIA